MMMRAAVIGHPVSHSRSPALFARFAAQTGVALAYEAVDVRPDELEATLARWREAPDFVGCNVTLPHKERALALADRVEPAACACGAANVITRTTTGDASHGAAVLVADNTDVAGVEAALALHGVALHGARVAVIGAGGAARAVTEAARRSGASAITVAARNVARASALAHDFNLPLTTTGHVARENDPETGRGGAPACVLVMACSLDDVPVADVYVNATPVGMQGQVQTSLLPANAPRGAAAFDLVYVPEETPFLIDARARGLRTVPGMAMFLAQAAATFEKWFGVTPPVDEAAPERPGLTLRQAQGDVAARGEMGRIA
jgi:shikimate dehydrogenase